jgi:hypothetical protein
MKYKRQLMLQDPKLAEEFEANEMHDDDMSMDETELSSPKAMERLTRPKRKIKVKEGKCTSHSCNSMKSIETWPYEPHDREDVSKSVDKVNERFKMKSFVKR